MKKILSLVVFVAALIWTWDVIHSTETIAFETHSSIQSKLSDLIQKTIVSRRPKAKDLSITRLWTETLSENKVRAIFAYKFIDVSEEGEALEQYIEGEAVLHREPSSEPNVDKWTLQSVKTTNDSVIFTEGSIITPSGDDEATEAEVETDADTETEAAPSAPDHHN